MADPINAGGWRFHLRWALSSLRVRRTRSVLTSVGIAVAVAIVTSIGGLGRGFERALADGIAGLGFQVLVTAKGCPYEAATMLLRGGRIPMYIDEALADRIAARDDVKSIARLFIQTVAVDEGRRTQFFSGIERSFLEMKPWLRFQRGGWFDGTDADQVILGYNVASELGLDAGDLFEVAAFERPLSVVGVFDRTGGQDDGSAFLPLARAQKLFDKREKLTGLGIQLRDIREVDRFVADVYELPSVQVISMSQVQGTLMRLADSSQALLLAVAILSAAIAALAVVNTVFMSVFERTREFGVLRALGGSRGRLLAVVCLETAMLSGVGALVGVLLAFGFSSGTEQLVRWVLPFSPAGSLLRFDLGVIALVVCGSVLLGVLCSLVPAWRATRVAPVRSLRVSQ